MLRLLKEKPETSIEEAAEAVKERLVSSWLPRDIYNALFKFVEKENITVETAILRFIEEGLKRTGYLQ